MNADRRSKRYGPFLDLMARLSGPSCSHLQLLFLENWELDTGQDLGQEDIWGSDEDYKENDGIMQVVPSGPLYPHQPVRDLTVELIANARERLLITTPYFVPGEPLMLELRLASHRGVQVDIVIPAKSDSRLADAASRAYCRKLLKDGINVYCHSTNLLHTKSISVDGQIAMIGSANYDLRSFQLDIESNLLLYSSDDVQSVIDIQESYLQETIPYQQRWGGRGAIRQLPDDVAKLLSPLM
jgi:cardiolipin synthase